MNYELLQIKISPTANFFFCTAYLWLQCTETEGDAVT
jgi:hypothetical protein